MKFKKIVFIDSNNTKLKSYTLFNLPIKEDVIIKKSISLFNDPEPCIIHRSFVIKKIAMEMYEFFKNEYKKGKSTLNINEIPNSILNDLNYNKSLNKINLI